VDSRRATDDEIETWRRDGWVLVEGLVGAEVIDEAAADLEHAFPTAAAYHADPDGETRRRLGLPPPPRGFAWPEHGPGFRPEQHRWRAEFPFPGSGTLNRLCVHPAIVDFMERALATPDIRLYQVGISAKYTGLVDYEQPMHTDRNHSWLPITGDAGPWHVESFLYLSDVDSDHAPTHLVAHGDSTGRSPTVLLLMPDADPEMYAAERPAVGRRGSLLAYRSDVFHRAVDLRAERGARFLLNVSYRTADAEWIGYDAPQSRANSRDWDAFVAGATPRELALFGFPPPAHPVWTEALLDATALRYPGLDLSPWRAALGGARRDVG
jgi:hypothetical protein